VADSSKENPHCQHAKFQRNHTHTHTHAGLCCTSTSTRTHAHTHARTHAHMRTHTQACTLAHIHTHTCRSQPTASGSPHCRSSQRLPGRSPRGVSHAGCRSGSSCCGHQPPPPPPGPGLQACEQRGVSCVRRCLGVFESACASMRVRVPTNVHVPVCTFSWLRSCKDSCACSTVHTLQAGAACASLHLLEGQVMPSRWREEQPALAACSGSLLPFQHCQCCPAALLPAKGVCTSQQPCYTQGCVNEGACP